MEIDKMDDISLSLQKEGFFILDGFLGTNTTRYLRDELDDMMKTSFMAPEPSTKSDPDGTVQYLSESHFFSAQFDVESKSPSYPHSRSYLDKISDILVKELNSRIPSLQLLKETQYHKFACSIGGGALLPKHMDNDGSNALDNRKLTIILYLNPNWKEEDGGKIRIHCLDFKNKKDIEPINDRILLFYSDIMVHEVLPVVGGENRYTLTLWLTTQSRDSNIHYDKKLYWKILHTHFKEYLHYN